MQDDDGYWYEWVDEYETYHLRAMCDWDSEEDQISSVVTKAKGKAQAKATTTTT